MPDLPHGAAPKGERQHMFDNPANVKRVMYALYVVSGLSLLLDFVIYRKVHHPWEAAPAFYAGYGFVACVVLVLAATQLRKLIMRAEDYYDPPVREAGKPWDDSDE